MKIQTLFENCKLEEGLSPILFHFVDLDRFMEMVNSGVFFLREAVGHDEKVNKGMRYFLSTSRTRTGSYHVNRNMGVLLTLDGRAIQHRLKGDPISYFENPHEFNETEDRVYSSSPEMEMDGVILKCDIYVSDLYANQLPWVTEFVKELQYENYSVALYTDKQGWLSGREQKAMVVAGKGRYHEN